MICPNCGHKMEEFFAWFGRNDRYATLDGLPENQRMLEHVVDYWSSGYGNYPEKIWYWKCSECFINGLKDLDNKIKYAIFVIFENGSIYGFFNDKWEKYEFSAEKVTFT